MLKFFDTHNLCLLCIIFRKNKYSFVSKKIKLKKLNVSRLYVKNFISTPTLKSEKINCRRNNGANIGNDLEMISMLGVQAKTQN